MTVQQSHVNLLEWAFPLPTGMEEGDTDFETFKSSCTATVIDEVATLTDIVNEQPVPTNYSTDFMSRGTWYLVHLGILYIWLSTPFGPLIPQVD